VEVLLAVGAGNDERADDRALSLTAKYADLWNTGYMGKPETMTEPLAKINAACRDAGRDRATLGITALIGLWFPDLQQDSPASPATR